MRSPADRRAPFERVARGAAMALVAVALWRVVTSLGEGGIPRVHVVLTGDLTARTRDSLAALARAGVRVTWSGELAAVAAMAEPVREPAAGWRVSVISRTAAALGDSLGPLDSLEAGGATVTAAGVRGALDVREGATTARTAPGDEASLGRVLVYGRAGWEAKFVIAALEEQGWRVDARLSVGRGIAVTQGGARGAGGVATDPPAPGLARHAAVVVLDTAIGRDAAAIVRFVRAGGGLVMAGAGAAAPALQGIAPARVTRLEPPETRDFAAGGPGQGAAHGPTHALPLHALGALRTDAVLLESRDGTPAAVARRVGAGRVVQLGYAETWRWRMQGETGAPRAHREFWSAIVGSAAAATYAPRARPHADGRSPFLFFADATPLASTVHALGAPSAAPARATERGPVLPPWLAPLILVLLVAEWASRRTRGAA